MKAANLARAVPLALGLAGLAALVFWWVSGPAVPLKPRLPGADREGPEAAGGGPLKWEGKLILASGTPAEAQGHWPGFRGPDLNGISPDKVPLARSWGEGGPKVLWKIDVGEGFAGASIWRGRVYLIDYDHKAQADAVRCLSLTDGQELWRYTYPVKVKRSHGMSRTIPTVTDKHLVTIGPKCQVVCLDPISGQLRWWLDLVREFNAEVPPWYAGQCPLVEGDRLLLGTGGDALVVAVDCATGKILWKSPNPRAWQMTHSSLTPVEFEARRLYVYCASGGVAGVSAEDGKVLWDTPEWKISIANVPSPVPVGAGRIFLCGGYNAGSMMLQLKSGAAGLHAEPLFRLKAAVFGSTQQTPIFHQGHLFGVRPDGQLVCLDLTGKVVWASGAAHKFGSGPYLIAQGLIFLLNDDGVLTLAEASTTGYRQLAQAKVLPGPDAWGPMALTDGRLVLRDLNRMACLDVAAK